MPDNINHPSHYADGWSNGAEVIDITEHLNFNRGNAVKYLARAGKKDPAAEVEDLKKARWYVEREIERLTGPIRTEEKTVFCPATVIPVEVGGQVEKPEPRTWRYCWEIPEMVPFRVGSGGIYRREGHRLRLNYHGSWLDSVNTPDSLDGVGTLPYVEVLEGGDV